MIALGLVVAGCAPGQRQALSRNDGKASRHTLTLTATPGTGAPKLVRLEIGGMTCQGCVARIQKQLEAVDGVHRVDVSLADQRALILADTMVRDTALTGAVRRAGPEFLGVILHR